MEGGVISAAEVVRWGAIPDDWHYFDLLLGLGGDLLPVVSNPSAEISPDSKMRDLGKTPSQYNRQGKVVGIADWTRHQTSSAEIERWMQQPDYGICLQTRNVRAIDVDVADTVKAAAVRDFIDRFLGQVLPCRHRGNSGKFLYAFRLAGEFAKRKMKVDGGIIEFLANGQQFIAIGTHTSGVRYEWDDGHMPADFPPLQPDAFEDLWAALAARFAVEPPTQARAGKGKGGEVDTGKGDPVADYLADKGHVLGIGRQGEMYITCPFKDEHSSDSGETETAYFRAGTGGYERGHFKCMHAHCDHRGDDEFLHAIGYYLDDFEVVKVDAGEPLPLPNFERDKAGAILATVDNVSKALRRPDMAGVTLAYDTFRAEIVLSEDAGVNWRSFTDADYVRLRINLERRGFKSIGKELIRDVVLLVADDQQIDTAQLWLRSLKWDGRPRIERFLIDYFSAADTPYTRAVALYTWTALAGRVLMPGCKADMVPILVGDQGLRKSSGVAAMAPGPEFFTEISFDEKDDNLSRKMRGRLIAEIGELRGLQSREIESIKAFITKTREDWTPKFREFNTVFPRRLIFIGTTNQEEFLADETGNRRWLPVRVGGVDVDGISRDCAQLWAEAREQTVKHGVQFREAETLAKDVHDEHRVVDSWEEALLKWLHTSDLDGDIPANRNFLRVRDVLIEALGFAEKNISRREEMRISKVLRAVGYVKADQRVGGRVLKVWLRPDATALL